MASGTVTLRLRPLRIAFLVDPADRSGLGRAIELSSFLWGGTYNPIIPAYLRTPSKWEPYKIGHKHLPSPSDIVGGYISGFDPDLVVPVGVCEKRSFDVGNRDIVKEDELVGDLKDSAAPQYGIGIPELLTDFLESELKYKRNDNLRVAFPKLPTRYGRFLASIFGNLSSDAQQLVDKSFAHPSISKFTPSLTQFPEFLKPHIFFPRRLISWRLEHHSREPQLFICNAKNAQDIIDYWNLRAAGYYVIPIPIQAAHAKNVMTLAREFIEYSYQPYRHNPRMFYYPTVQVSRSVDEDVASRFCQSLSIAKEASGNPKYRMHRWYPRLRDAWSGEYGSERIIFPYSSEQERRVSEGEGILELRSQDPIFSLGMSSGKPKFANEFSFRFYGSKEPMAEVFPEGSRELSSAIGRTNYFNCRFSRSGPVFLAHNARELIFLDLPLAETVMTEWFRERGWKVSLSGAGRIGKQLLKQLGGASGISWLAHKGIFEMLGDLEKEGGMARQAVIGRLRHISNSNKLSLDAESFLERLITVNALRLGAKIQCPVCMRHNWYELNALDYTLRCRFCLSSFAPPLKSPKEIEWTYRAHGPFAGSTAQGAFAVLLTLKLLGGNNQHGITPLLSYIAEKDGKQLEADLTCLYRSSNRNDARASLIYVIHAECKSFNYFDARDIARMKELAIAFPGAALVFATLKEELQDTELQLIRSMVAEERDKRNRGEPHSPIIILTGIELFSLNKVGYNWKGRGGLYDRLGERSFELADLPNLADATQQLYLGLPSWYEQFTIELEKPRQKQAGNRNRSKGGVVKREA